MRKIDKIILHCSANGPNSKIGVKEIRDYHVKQRGWKDIGYHYVIKRNGVLETGRPIEQAGAHCTGYNANSIGICLVGGIDNAGMPQDNFTPEQFEKLAQFLRVLRLKYPKATIHGHNEFANKACPVFDVKKFLERYGIPKIPGQQVPAPKVIWDEKRWPHFKPKEFTALWGDGPMPELWEEMLDALERLRAKYGKPMVLAWTFYNGTAMTCAVKVPPTAQALFSAEAYESGFDEVWVEEGSLDCVCVRMVE